MRLILLLLLFATYSLCAQDPRLAQQYFDDGEYEKASVLFKSLYQKTRGSEVYFNKYIDCLIHLKNYKESEEVIKNEIKIRPKDVQLYVVYGALLEIMGEDSKAEKQYEEALDKLTADVTSIHRLGNAFVNANRYDLALATYEKGERLMQPNVFFTYNLADLYRRKGDLSTMIKYYLEGLQNKTVQLNNVQSLLIAYLGPEQFSELQSQLYQKIEQFPENNLYGELLMWSFVQMKDYSGAMRQAKALDRKLNENGNRIYTLAMTAYLDNDYRTAIDGFNHLREKGPGGSFYHEACRQSLVCQRNMIVEKKNYQSADLFNLRKDYQKYKEEFGNNYLSAALIIEYAELEARYLNNISQAIELLEELVKSPYVEIHIKAKAKLDLADYYLITGERWESTLLYSQVDKDFSEDELGEMARFKNARLSYFAGDFEWAQEQFDILKRATSRLIANDAIDLSVFIMDNLNQDTTGASLLQFSSAELKLFQNQYDSALLILDGISFSDPEIRFLEDDVWYLQAQIFHQQRNTTAAIERYEMILEKHPEEIRADNALYALARIYDHEKEDLEKAKSYYEKLFLDYSSSILAVEARKRYRQLRGDKMQ